MQQPLVTTWRRVQALRLTLLALALAWTALAHADRHVLPDADAAAIRAIVEAQLAAFAADDPETAYSFASNGIKETFATPQQFFAMVKGAYPVVYRPASVTFLPPEEIDDEVVQPVQMADDSDRLWLAIYRMERQSDNSWKISGCVLANLPGARS